MEWGLVLVYSFPISKVTIFVEIKKFLSLSFQIQQNIMGSVGQYLGLSKHFRTPFKIFPLRVKYILPKLNFDLTLRYDQMIKKLWIKHLCQIQVYKFACNND